MRYAHAFLAVSWAGTAGWMAAEGCLLWVALFVISMFHAREVGRD